MHDLHIVRHDPFMIILKELNQVQQARNEYAIQIKEEKDLRRYRGEHGIR